MNVFVRVCLVALFSMTLPTAVVSVDVVIKGSAPGEEKGVTTLRDLKKRIFLRIFIGSPLIIVVKFAGNELKEDNKSLSDYGISEGGALEVQAKAKLCFTVENTVTGHSYSLVGFLLSDSIWDLKKRYAEMIGVDAHTIELFLNNKKCEDSRSFKSLGMNYGGQLIFEHREEVETHGAVISAQYDFQGVQGLAFSLRISPETTVADVKQKIADMCELVEPHEVVIGFGDTDLRNDSQTLASYGIEDGGTIYYYFSLPSPKSYKWLLLPLLVGGIVISYGIKKLKDWMQRKHKEDTSERSAQVSSSSL